MKKTRFPALIAVLFLLLSAVSCGKSDGSTVMKLGGFDVRYDICKYALRAERASLEEKYGGDLPETDGIDAELREGALAFLRNVYAVLSLAQEHGLSRDDPTVRGEVNSKISAAEAEAGGREEFLASLKEEGLSESVFVFMTEVGVLSDELYYAMLNSGEIDSDPERVRAFVDGDGCVRIKQILVTAKDRTDDEARARAEEARSRAEAGEDFDALISEYNEDMRMFSNPQGYYLMRGVWHREFEDASFALAVGEISPVTKTVSGYSVIKRYEKDSDYITKHFDSLTDDYRDSVFSLAREKRAAELEITDSDEFDKLDVVLLSAKQ